MAMKDLLLLMVRKFLQPRVLPGKPLLVGYSGGPDSKALLHLLLECRRFFPLELHLAHVDHGWREESKKEVEEIKAEAGSLGQLLHLKSLSSKDFSPGNSEEQGRDQRLLFFAQTYHRIGAQALLLGHHADDQAETVLKRVCEGASLYSLGGLAMASLFQEMQIWRPLLGVKKKQILEWLSQKNLNYFQDPTNFSLKFLRGKMREGILPHLSASFGKQVAGNLCRLGEESKEIKDYFFNLNKPIMGRVQKRGKEDHLDLTPFLPLPALQLRYLLKEWMHREKVVFSRQMIDGIVLALCDCVPRKKFISKEGEFRIESGHLCFFKK
jgi:tRNA(Ile)-lysidine synthase